MGREATAQRGGAGEGETMSYGGAPPRPTPTSGEALPLLSRALGPESPYPRRSTSRGSTIDLVHVDAAAARALGKDVLRLGLRQIQGEVPARQLES